MGCQWLSMYMFSMLYLCIFLICIQHKCVTTSLWYMNETHRIYSSVKDNAYLYHSCKEAQYHLQFLANFIMKWTMGRSKMEECYVQGVPKLRIKHNIQVKWKRTELRTSSSSSLPILPSPLNMKPCFTNNFMALGEGSFNQSQGSQSSVWMIIFSHIKHNLVYETTHY